MKSKEFYEIVEGTWLPDILDKIGKKEGDVFKCITKKFMLDEWVTDTQIMETQLLEFLKGKAEKPDMDILIVQFMKLYLFCDDSVGELFTYNKLFQIVKNVTAPRCLTIMRSKGDVYSGDIDKLKNFKDVAKDAGISIEQAWIVFFNKHYRSILAWCGGDYRDSESITGRIDDAVNYLLLLIGILGEKEGKI